MGAAADGSSSGGETRWRITAILALAVGLFVVTDYLIDTRARAVAGEGGATVPPYAPLSRSSAPLGEVRRKSYHDVLSYQCLGLT
jgi:hypothetical protein